MNCYLDKTFCDGNGGKCAKFGPCHRSLTESVKNEADAFGLAIARFTTPEELDCYTEEAQPQEEGGLF